MIRSSNPAFNDNFYSGRAAQTQISSSESMTASGAANKTIILLFLIVCSASYVWREFFLSGTVSGLVWIGAIAGLVLALITVFKPTWSPITAPIYALCEGLMLGGISAFMEAKFPGIVIQAVGLTFGTLLALLFAYRAGYIRVTEKFRAGVVAATFGIVLVYLASFILRFFGTGIPYIHEGGIIGIGFSAFVVVIAALNLVLDFDFIEKGARSNMPKHMEWYSAFGLTVTLVWLYIEFLVLLSKLRD